MDEKRTRERKRGEKYTQSDKREQRLSAKQCLLCCLIHATHSSSSCQMIVRNTSHSEQTHTHKHIPATAAEAEAKFMENEPN